ncbi:MAG: NAD-dependent epimerase/dehydratase family protein, partial [SAR202 cluster bacterium]|nr:NAD-dependent epimerase/dehydratase family protein [SAR202 cluster bacterium]
MKICVIGCTGYIGSKICNEIGKSRDQLFGLCRQKPKKEKFFLRNFFQIIEGDIKSYSVQKKIADYKFDVIIYTVSLNHTDSENNLKK